MLRSKHGWSSPAPRVSLALMVLAGCASGPALQTTLPDHMYVHFARVGEVQTAVVQGDLDAARGAARWLRDHGTHPGLPQAGWTYMDELRSRAAEVVSAMTVEDAAHPTAEMARTCGACHIGVGIGPRMSLNTSPPPGSPPGQHMLRHLWAADRLWEGLIGPSNELWELGAAALMETALDLGPSGGPPGAIVLAERVHELGKSGRNVGAAEERAEIYGEFLKTCASCHSLLGVATGSR